MDSHILFSVIIANYNNGCYMQEAIDSVLKQDYDNWEIVIVDDASPDNSKEIYDKYKEDSRFRIVFNETNKGYAYSVNRGVELAQGEICARLDPDDVLVGTDVLKTHIQKHLEMPEVTMVYSGQYRADEHLNIFREMPGLDVLEGSSLLEMSSWPVHHLVSFKRKAFLAVGGMDVMMRRAQDYDLYYKLEEAGRIYHLDAIQYIQRQNPRSASLGDNAYKADAWHTYACVEAMKRRGLTDESLMLFPIEAAMWNAFHEGYEKATRTRIYRVGLAIATPFLWLQKSWKK